MPLDVLESYWILFDVVGIVHMHSILGMACVLNDALSVLNLCCVVCLVSVAVGECCLV